MAIAFRGAGTASGVSANATGTLGVPTGTAAGDLLIIVAHSRTDAAHSIGNSATGWAEVGTQAGDATGGRLSVWYKVTSGTESPLPTITYTGTAESLAGQMLGFYGQAAAGSEFDVIGTNSAQASAATYVGAALTTNYVNSMQCFAVGCMDNSVFTVSAGLITQIAGQHANGNGTDNAIALAYDDTPGGTTIGSQTAPQMTKTLQSDPGRVLTFFIRELVVPVKLLAMTGVG